MIRNSQTGRFDHRQIVRTITDSHRLGMGNFMFFSQFQQRFGLILRINDIADDFSRQLAVTDTQLIGNRCSQPQLVAQVFGKEGEATGCDRHFPAQRFQL